MAARHIEGMQSAHRKVLKVAFQKPGQWVCYGFDQGQMVRRAADSLAADRFIEHDPLLHRVRLALPSGAGSVSSRP